MASHWFLREARGNSRRVPWDISWGISSGIRSTFFSAWDHAVSHGIPWDIRTAMLSTIRRLGGRGNIWCQWRGVECRRLSKMVLKRKQTFRGASRKVLQYARSLQEEEKAGHSLVQNSRGETTEVLGERDHCRIDWRIRFVSEWNMYDHVRYIVRRQT